MKTKRKFGATQIPCKGKVIIQHLDIARRLLIAMPFKTEVQLAHIAASAPAENFFHLPEPASEGRVGHVVTTKTTVF